VPVVDCHRRDFLKIMGLAGTSATMGCSTDAARKLIPYLIPAREIIPGEATWYATTCRECPAGCGLLAKNRDGRIIKVEGNPDHPVNRGGLCARGQASLHGLYNPDRFTGPARRREGRLVPLSWETAQGELAGRLRSLRRQGGEDRIVFLSDLTDTTLEFLIREWLAALGGGRHLSFEPLAYEGLRAANREVFGEDTIPLYRLDEADLLISFGAGFLETWLSNVEYARRFAIFHEPREGRKNLFVSVGPRRSLTSASADLHLMVRPGGEAAVAMALLELLRLEVRQGNLPLDGDLARALEETVGSFSWIEEAGRFGITAENLDRLAHRFMAAERPLVLAGGLPLAGEQSTAVGRAANLLCLLKPGSRQLIDFRAAVAPGRAAPAAAFKELSERMGRGEIDLLLVLHANPVFSLPPSWEFARNLRQVETVVSFTPWPDETTALAHLLLPVHTFLESWGDYSPRDGVHGLMQPVMGPMFDTRPAGDLLLEAGRAAGRAAGLDRELPWPDYYALLRDRWQDRWQQSGASDPFEHFWQEAVRRGGHWEEVRTSRPPALAVDFQPRPPQPGQGAEEGDGYALVVYPTIQFFDGRMANRPWLQELPDPVTQTTWGGWVEMHPETAARLGAARGDMVRLATEHGAIEAPVLPITTVLPGTVALPIGQGHVDFGRYADHRPANVMQLLSPEVDPRSGGLRMAGRVTLTRIEGRYDPARTDGSFFQHGRDLARQESFPVYRQAVAAGRPAEVDMPLAEGFDPHQDFYPAHGHPDYRWCMVVDLDRCIGCGACVVACYAENNVAVVGREQMLLGREMSWLRIQRYFDADGATFRFLPMLCQHCDAAPCESVCPIFAPHHSIDGLNNQVYNRCFGTRFCSQNDPYKVRRFNWFTFTRPAPLEWQLNPDVTVRQKGVMEKCSFCVQRIVAAKSKAREENRRVRDGEFTTACAQSCPTGALIFGNLVDPESRVARLSRDPRAYQVLRHLNTKPAVIYLKRLTQEI